MHQVRYFIHELYCFNIIKMIKCFVPFIAIYNVFKNIIYIQKSKLTYIK